MTTSMDVANYFLATAPQDTMSNLKLVKMCSYAQAISLAYLGKPLFNDPIEAWEHGPVIPEVYHSFKAHGGPIESRFSEHFAQLQFDERQCLVLAAVNSEYGRYEPWALRNQSHLDFPGEFGSSAPIPQDAIKNAFMKNKLVLRLKENDFLAGIGDSKILSEEEFWNAVDR